MEDSYFIGIPVSSKMVKWSMGGTLLFVLLAGCGASPTPLDPRANQMVYYDRDTKQPLVENVSRTIPAIHPKTGQATLVPASYCPECKQWLPSPPIEVRERNPEATRCPKGHALTQDGPWPATP